MYYNRTFGIFFKKSSSQRCGIIENKRSIINYHYEYTIENTKLKYGREILNLKERVVLVLDLHFER